MSTLACPCVGDGLRLVWRDTALDPCRLVLPSAGRKLPLLFPPLPQIQSSCSAAAAASAAATSRADRCGAQLADELRSGPSCSTGTNGAAQGTPAAPGAVAPAPEPLASRDAARRSRGGVGGALGSAVRLVMPQRAAGLAERLVLVAPKAAGSAPLALLRACIGLGSRLRIRDVLAAQLRRSAIGDACLLLLVPIPTGPAAVLPMSIDADTPYLCAGAGDTWRLVGCGDGAASGAGLPRGSGGRGARCDGSGDVSAADTTVFDRCGVPSRLLESSTPCASCVCGVPIPLNRKPGNATVSVLTPATPLMAWEASLWMALVALLGDVKRAVDVPILPSMEVPCWLAVSADCLNTALRLNGLGDLSRASAAWDSAGSWLLAAGGAAGGGRASTAAMPAKLGAAAPAGRGRGGVPVADPWPVPCLPCCDALPGPGKSCINCGTALLAPSCPNTPSLTPDPTACDPPCSDPPLFVVVAGTKDTLLALSVPGFVRLTIDPSWQREPDWDWLARVLRGEVVVGSMEDVARGLGGSRMGLPDPSNVPVPAPEPRGCVLAMLLPLKLTLGAGPAASPAALVRALCCTAAARAVAGLG